MMTMMMMRRRRIRMRMRITMMLLMMMMSNALCAKSRRNGRFKRRSEAMYEAWQQPDRTSIAK